MKKRMQKQWKCVLLPLLGCTACMLGTQSVQAQALRAERGEHTRTPLSPAAEQRMEQSSELGGQAAQLLHAGQYAEAEAKARQAMAIWSLGISLNVLEAALAAQGKDQEALQLYQATTLLEKDGPKGQARDLLPYALLLLKSDQWAQALVVYNNALPWIPDVGFHNEMPVVHDGDVIRANSHFSPDVPDAIRLATAIHIALGLVYNSSPDWVGESQNKGAFAEYGKALQLAPNSALANYYYGVGWQKLSPAEQQQFGSIQQARAALTKAVRLAKGPLKVKAQKALMVAMKTK